MHNLLQFTMPWEIDDNGIAHETRTEPIYGRGGIPRKSENTQTTSQTNTTMIQRLNEVIERLDNLEKLDKTKRYHVLCHNSMERFTDKLIKAMGSKCEKHNKINWGRFGDGSDEIKIEGLTSPTQFQGKHILFVAAFNDNDSSMSQLHTIAFLCECLAESVTVLLMYYPTGTMERVDIGADGVIPTANTLALLFNGLPSVGSPIRIMTYDLHTLQNRFYFTGHALATLHTAIPLITEKIKEVGIKAIAFPDEGAHKRFASLFKATGIKGDDVIICSKQRFGTDKRVVIADGNPANKHVIIIDDQTKTAGTLLKCAKTLKEKGATAVSAFVTHTVCTDEFWSKFLETNNQTSAEMAIFHSFYATDSVPALQVITNDGLKKTPSYTTKSAEENESTITKEKDLKKDNILLQKIVILELAQLIVKDL